MSKTQGSDLRIYLNGKILFSQLYEDKELLSSRIIYHGGEIPFSLSFTDVVLSYKAVALALD